MTSHRYSGGMTRLRTAYASRMLSHMAMSLGGADSFSGGRDAPGISYSSLPSGPSSRSRSPKTDSRRNSSCRPRVARFSPRALNRMVEGSRLPRGQEIEHPLPQEGGCVRVVGRQRAIGEVVLVARVEEQLAVLGLLDERAGGVDVALIDEVRVG